MTNTLDRLREEVEMNEFHVEYFAGLGQTTANSELREWLQAHQPIKWQVIEESGGFWLIAETQKGAK